MLLSLSATGSLPGCGDGATEPSNGAADEGSVCPPEDPDCDRLDEPCVPDEATPPAGESTAPGSNPMGLGSPLSSSGKHLIWPKGRVPYKIASTLDATTKTRVLSAMSEWQSKTKQVVRFEKATSADAAYVLVTTGSPRVEFVGYKSNTVSKLYLRDNEYLTVTRHELGHVLGLEHEMRRKDRAASIQVLSANIVNTANCKYQFSLCSNCPTLGKYNIKSVMHYRTYRDLASCRVNNKAVLLTKAGGTINHEWVLTAGDLSAIWELYGQPTTGTGGTGGVDAGIDASAGADSGADAADAAGAAGAAGSAGSAGAAGSDGIEGDNPWTDSGIESGVGGSGATGGSSGNNTTVMKDGSESGCGCRLGPEPARPWVLAAVFGLFFLSARRRGARGGTPLSR